MATWRSDTASIRIDNASGTLTDISRWVNDYDLGSDSPTLDDTGLTDTRGRTAPALPEAPTVSMNGRLCSTTESIFGPLVNGTSITKTFEAKHFTGKYHVGEVTVSNVRLVGTAKQLGTWSASFTAENGLTRTSVAAS